MSAVQVIAACLFACVLYLEKMWGRIDKRKTCVNFFFLLKQRKVDHDKTKLKTRALNGFFLVKAFFVLFLFLNCDSLNLIFILMSETRNHGTRPLLCLVYRISRGFFCRKVLFPDRHRGIKVV